MFLPDPIHHRIISAVETATKTSTNDGPLPMRYQLSTNSLNNGPMCTFADRPLSLPAQQCASTPHLLQRWTEPLPKYAVVEKRRGFRELLVYQQTRLHAKMPPQCPKLCDSCRYPADLAAMSLAGAGVCPKSPIVQSTAPTRQTPKYRHLSGMLEKAALLLTWRCCVLNRRWRISSYLGQGQRHFCSKAHIRSSFHVTQQSYHCVAMKPAEHTPV